MDETGASFSDQLKAGLQYLLPKHAITGVVHLLARMENPAVKNWLIRHFVRRFKVNMQEAAASDCTSYPSFNAFFTRALRDGARPIVAAAEAIACPVDGCVSQIGETVQDRIFQAKGRTYSTQELLAGEAEIAGRFAGGRFATLYLSPRDYHRIHMPLDGSLQQMWYVPGRLFSVNPGTTRAVPALFARNERVVTIFNTAAGPMALVMVGALNVGSIETVWAGEITPPRRKTVSRWDYRVDEVSLKKGAELGRFNMGSTVILLFEPQRICWQSQLAAGTNVRVGQGIATIL